MKGYESMYAVFDTSVQTLNLGDQIIMESVYYELNKILESSFFINLSTHTYSNLRVLNYIKKRTKYFIVGGTNLLTSDMFINRKWKVNALHSMIIRNQSILMGVGWNSYSGPPDLYTKALLKRLLSKDMYHSVRDSYALDKLKVSGINNVLNTGCPTTWRLNEAHCSKIPASKAESAVITITDYAKKQHYDELMVDMILSEYKKVYLWIQGSGDYKYFQMLDINHQAIEVIPPKLQAYQTILENNDVDYIGTRLHAGIKALQMGKRAIIVIVDNRAREIGKDIGLNVIEREDLFALNQYIQGEMKTQITLPHHEIERWRNQFFE